MTNKKPSSSPWSLQKKLTLGGLGIIFVIAIFIFRNELAVIYKGFSASRSYNAVCSSSDSSWECVAADREVRLLSIRSSDNSLWGILGEAIFGYTLDAGQNNYTALNPSDQFSGHILHNCPAEKIWVDALYDSATGVSQTIVTYNLEMGIWDLNIPEQYPLLEGPAQWGCTTSRDSSVIFWHGNWVGRFDGLEWTQSTIDTQATIVRFSEDEAGGLWALTDEGDFYRRDESLWSLFGRMAGPSFESGVYTYRFEVQGEVLWFLSQDKLYQWQLDGSNSTAELVYTFPQSEIARGIYEDSEGVLWLVWPTGMSVYANHRLTEFELPKGVSTITGAAFDHDLQRLYLATDVGIFYMDVGQTINQFN